MLSLIPDTLEYDNIFCDRMTFPILNIWGEPL